MYFSKHVDGETAFFQREYEGIALQDYLIGASGLQLFSAKCSGETWFPYERLNCKMPRSVKIPLVFLAPLFPKLFLCRVEPGVEPEPEAAVFGLRNDAQQVEVPRE